MYNFHSHSLLSDGELLPSEVAVRYMAGGYKAIAITDHADYSNIDFIVRCIVNFAAHWPKDSSIQVLPGVELSHLPLGQFKPLAAYARKNGIKVIIAHGESPVEPVIKGTNLAALGADIDILAHPGKISPEEVKLAKARGIFLEITSRKGHDQGNAHVACLALRYGAGLVLNNDSHSPEDIIAPKELLKVAAKAGLSVKEIECIIAAEGVFLRRKMARANISPSLTLPTRGRESR